MTLGPTTLGTLTKGEGRNTIQVSIQCTSPSGAATPLEGLILATSDEDDWVNVGSGELSIGSKNLTREEQGSVGIRG